jgi:hypothetical protein
MKLLRHTCLTLALLVTSVTAAAQGTPPNPLAPLAHWAGGTWAGQFDTPGGRKTTLIRS